MCNCGCGSGGSCIIDLTGIGQVGDTGATGGYGGWSSLWEFSTTTTNGTTDGQVRLNSATYASVTGIYLNIMNADSTDVTNFLNSFANGNSYGKIRLFKESDSNTFWEGTITGHSIVGSECRLVVTYTLSNLTFAATDHVVVTFTPNGVGSNLLLYTDITAPSSATTGSWVTPAGGYLTYTMPAGTLATDGDFVEITYWGIYENSPAITSISGIRGIINGANAITNDWGGYSITGDNELLHYVDTTNEVYFELKLKIMRYDNTSVRCYSVGTINMQTPVICITNGGAPIATNALDASSNTIEPQFYQAVGAQIVIYDVKVVKYIQ